MRISGGGVETLLLPYAFYNVVLTVFYALLTFASSHSFIASLNYVLDWSIGILCAWRFDHNYCCHLWFLLCLFWNKLIIGCILRFIHSQRFQDISISICVAIGIILKWANIKQLPGCIDIAFISLAFTYVGFRTKDFWMSYHSAKLVFVAVAVFALSVTLNYKLSGNVQVGFFSGEFGFFSLFFLTALSGIFLTVSLSYRIGYHKILSYLGKNSLTIYVLHYIPLGILWIVTNKVCSTSNQSNLQALAIGIILTMVVCTIMVPIVEFVNKHMAWTIGKKRN